MSSYIANPISRKKIREITNFIRKQFGLSDETFFPVIHFLEFGMPEIDNNFNFEVVPINEMNGCYAETYPEKSKIDIREDVYDRATDNIPRDRFTIAHEIGHFIMHRPGRIAFARGNRLEQLPAFKNPEWQANTFAGELLAPPNIIRGWSLHEVTKNCGVSQMVAEIQMSQL